MVVDLSVRDRASEHRCPYCHGVVRPSDDGWICGSCGAVHHGECFREHGRCSVHGCSRSASGTLRPSLCGPPPRAERRWLSRISRWAPAIVGLASVAAVFALALLSVPPEIVTTHDHALPGRWDPHDLPAHEVHTPVDAEAHSRMSSVGFLRSDRIAAIDEAGELAFYDRDSGAIRGHVGVGRIPTWSAISATGVALLGTPFRDDATDLALVSLDPSSAQCPILGATRRGRGTGWRTAALSASGERAFVVTTGGWIEEWNLADRTLLGECSGDATISAIANYSGSAAITGDWYGDVRVWDLASRSEVRAFAPNRGEIVGLATRYDGLCAVAATTGNSTTLFTIDVGSGEVRSVLEVRSRSCVVAFDSRGRRAISGSATGDLHLWDLDAGTVRKLDEVCAIEHAAFSPDGKSVVTSSRGVGPIVVRDVETGKVLVNIRVD